MEIDLGGIGKEYAVDSAVKLIKQITDISFLVNFGGDIACPLPRKNNIPWIIGVDDPENTGESSIGKISLYHGGLATSGDARRFLLKDGIRYSHILNPHTGYPVIDAPRSVTVISDTCLEAGMLSTFAMLEGDNAVAFLNEQDVQFWCIP
jgi:thiamine biosynthesis lipoprotein